MPQYYCNNCGKPSHSAAKCYAPGGGLDRQGTWRGGGNNEGDGNGPRWRTAAPVQNSQVQQIPPSNADIAQFANVPKKDIVMMAYIEEVTKSEPRSITLSTNTAALSAIQDSTHVWLVNSGASSHLCRIEGLFDELHSTPSIIIETASGDLFRAEQRGTIRITLQSDTHMCLPPLALALTDVIFVPKLNANLLSIGRMTAANVDIAFGKDNTSLWMDNEMIARGTKINNLFTYLAQPTIDPKPEQAAYSSQPNDLTLWHHRLAHAGASTIERMVKMQTGVGLPQIEEGQQLSQCVNCPFSKQSRSPFKNTEENPKTIGDLISSDICGPFETSIGGYRYFVTWIDHATQYVQVEFLKNKECEMVTKSFRDYITWLKKQTREDVRRVRTDNGGEYMGKQFVQTCSELGIVHETTSPHTPEHNGVAERYNRTLQEGALTLQHDAGLTGRFWVSGIHTVNFVKNRLLHCKIGASPYEAFWGTKPRLDWLRTYGSRCWSLIPKATRRKGDFKSVEGIFVGYFDDS
jgi:Pol polyprotein, beta-barrel domain/Integrase core domain/GAG-pre-integrase domain